MNTNCPTCEVEYKLKETQVGRKFQCKNCYTALRVTEAGIVPRDRPPVRPTGDAGGGTPTAVGRQDDTLDFLRRAGRMGQGNWGEYLAFRKMVVPVIIQVIFWVMTGGIVLAGIAFLAMSVLSGSVQAILMGIAACAVGIPICVLMVRVYCELLIVVFRINDNLTDIKDALDNR